MMLGMAEMAIAARFESSLENAIAYSVEIVVWLEWLLIIMQVHYFS